MAAFTPAEMEAALQKMDQVEQLQVWLKHQCLLDVLAVAAKGVEYPKYPHREHTWDWPDFEALTRTHKPFDFIQKFDVGILLSGLCVVDVGSVAQAAALEERFPVLKTAPRERTTKGMHYYFVRSAKADAEGYYNGRAQREKGIDFRSVCHTGTSGFVLAAPSAGQEWIVPLWEVPPFSIPDCLLDAVARPRNKPCNITVAFPDDPSAPEALQLTNSAIIQDFEVFKTFLELDSEGEELWPAMAHVLPLAGLTRRTFEDLLYTCKHGITPEFPEPEMCERIILAADFLGVPNWHLRHAFGPGGSAYTLCDTERMLHRMGREIYNEQWCRVSGTDLACKEVCMENLLPPVRVNKTDDWLFTKMECPRPVVWDSEVLDMMQKEQAFPDFVYRWLRAHPQLVLAGGAPLAHLMNRSPHDYDFFVHGLPYDQDGYDKATAIVHSLLDQGAHLLTGTPFAVTLNVDGHTAQVILRLYRSPEHVLSTFDLQPCKIAAFLDADKDRVVVKAAPSWFVAMSTGCQAVDVSMWGVGSAARVLKYASHGFDPYVPCVYDTCIDKSALMFSKGLGRLLLVQSITAPTMSSASGYRPSPEEMQRIMSSLYLPKSEYNLCLPSEYSMCFNIMPFELHLGKLQWTVARNNNFRPQRPGWKSFCLMDMWFFKQVTSLFPTNGICQQYTLKMMRPLPSRAI